MLHRSRAELSSKSHQVTVVGSVAAPGKTRTSARLLILHLPTCYDDNRGKKLRCNQYSVDHPNGLMCGPIKLQSVYYRCPVNSVCRPRSRTA